MNLSRNIRTFAALGIGNIVRVGAYRLGLKTGLGRVRRLRAAVPAGPFFMPPAQIRDLPATGQWRDEASYFSYHRFALGDSAPDWFLNPFTNKRLDGNRRPWWQIPDFDAAAGDIKVIWEPSRFDWVLAAAQRSAAGDQTALPRLEDWLQDWCEKNPPYYGPNWKCGQETSIRVLHLAMSSVVLGNPNVPTPGLRSLIEVHLKRIEPTTGYAIGQDNNHGTSEAAALFVGGSWLEGAGHPQGVLWKKRGRRMLEDRVKRLVAEDGSFSQHSLTYHRMLLDTLVMAEVWRRLRELPPFSQAFQRKARSAAEWLFAFTDRGSGDGPNLGSNDGARLLPLTDTGYRDFRPSVQAAMALFANRRAYADTENDLALGWLNVALPKTVSAPPRSRLFDDGGYALLRTEDAMAVLRYPRFRFRPAQADALHVDLWIGGRNMLRDAGTFSYGVDFALLDRFSGTAGHNTVQFDGRNQMPRVGRFLFAEWLKADGVTFDEDRNVASAGYTDWKGARHHRTMQLTGGKLRVQDELAGSFGSAVLRWRLAPGDWALEEHSVSDGRHRLTIAADAPITRVGIVSGEESLHYLERHPVPVLEVEMSVAGTITSEFTWS